MSVISIYNEPSDILFKIIREGRRAWLSEAKGDKCDHFLNFCVTAQSLRDWCIKYLGLSGADSNAFHDDVNLRKYIPECRDIANSSKHFGLRNSISLVDSAKPCESTFHVLSNMGTTASEKRSDIKLMLSSGEEVDLFIFLHSVVSEWIEILKSRGIPFDPTLKPEVMFVEFR